MGTQIALVRADNWEGLYVNEKLVAEHHYITIEDVMKHVLYYSVDAFDVYEASNDWLADYGNNFPKYLPEVVLSDGRTIEEYWERE
jgi:hypothetical protein